MAEEYENFDLYLKWHEREGISVNCRCPAVDPSVDYYSPPMPWSVSVPPTNTPFSTLQTEGGEIADILLPKGEIRDLFRKWWDLGKKIRLRLIYPHPDFDNNDDAVRQAQINKLMSFQWEYVYLAKNQDNDPPASNFLLSLNQDISIVHYLRDSIPNSIPPIENLPVSIQYISNLGPGNLGNEGDIRGEFEQEIANIKETIEHESIIHQPDSFDVHIGFRDNHLVHITTHGTLAVVQVGAADVLTALEALLPFELTQESRVRAIILLSCSSSPEGESFEGIAARLHRRSGVPAVIGMTGSIRPIPDAQNFVRGFYKGLASRPTVPLEKAVSMARWAMFQQEHTDSTIDNLSIILWNTSFGLPRLFLNGPDSILIPEALLFGSLETMVRSFDDIIKAESRAVEHKLETNEYLQELITGLITWIEQEKNAWYLVTGGAGSGKTTLIARLLSQLAPNKRDSLESSQIIYHFCQKKDTKTSDPLEFIRYSLVPQLVDRYGEDYTNLIEGKFPLLVGNEKEAMREFVIKPLFKLKDKIKLPVIIIDGIDVVDPNYSILDLLVDHQGDLEDVARFMVIADDVDAGFLVDENLRNARKIMEDIYWLTNQYQDNPSHLIVQDNPQLLFRELEDRFASLLPEKPLITAWKELYSLFERAMEAARQKHKELDWWEKKVSLLLEVVAVAYEPLPADIMAVIIGLEPEGDKIAQLQSGLQPFFNKYEDYENKFDLYHDSLKRCLLRQMDYWHDNSLANTHDLFVQAFLPESGVWTTISNWKTLSGTKWSEMSKDQLNVTIPGYARRYLSYHAYYSYYYTSWNHSRKRQTRARNFLSLICDSRFRNARVNEVGQQAALQDIQLGLRVINTQYIHTSSPDKNHKKARVAFDRLLATDRPNSLQRNKLIELERVLRNGSTAGVETLFDFLDLDAAWWEA